MASEPSSHDQTSEPGVAERVDALLKQIRSHSRRISRAKNVLKAVKGKELKATSYPDWLDTYGVLDGYELGAPEVDELRVELVEALAAEMPRLKLKARMAFIQKLEMLADQAEVELQKTSEAPLVLYAEPLTFEIDFDAGGARLLYGHEPIDELPLQAKALLEARADALAELDKAKLGSEEFFDLLLGAYRMALAAEGLEAGERVDLVDVLLPLSMLRAGRDNWRKKGLDALEPYPRHLLAWQLAQLRKDGQLERGGLRLDLGAATGGSTRDKRDVLYIPVGPKSGQYYGSIRFERR